MSTLLTKKAALHIALLLVSWVVFFHHTLFDMVSAWNSSDTFQHCFIIAPISVWLLWRRRFMLAELDYRPALLLLIPVLFSSFLWYAGTVTGIRVIAHFAVIAWLFFGLWALLGNQFFRIAWFPLCYLFFMVPIGDEIVPQLQVITADISVLLLTWTGIPVFREGLYLAIPNGMFEVAVACSGIRYLIASIALGTLYAHLQYHSLKRQFIFLIVAIIVPIIANGIRAYFIVLLAHISDMKLATGVDHLLYGWVFFGLVMFLLFWAGNYWRQSTAEPQVASHKTGRWCAVSQSYLTLFVMIASLAAAAILSHQVATRTPNIQSLDRVKLSSVFESKELGSWQPSFANADDYYQGKVKQSEGNAELYLALYSHNSQQKELINYNNQLFNIDRYTPISHQIINDELGTYGIYEIAAVTGQKHTIYYWYQLSDFDSANPTRVKLALSWKTLTSQPDVGAVVILATETTPTAKPELTELISKIKQLGSLW